MRLFCVLHAILLYLAKELRTCEVTVSCGVIIDCEHIPVGGTDGFIFLYIHYAAAACEESPMRAVSAIAAHCLSMQASVVLLFLDASLLVIMLLYVLGPVVVHLHCPVLLW